MKAMFKEKWNTLSPKTRKSIVLLACGSILLFVVVLGWLNSKASGVKVGNKEAAQQEIKLEDGVIEKSKTADYELRLAQTQKQLEALKQGKPIDESLAELDPRATSNFVAPIVAKNYSETTENDGRSGTPADLPGTPSGASSSKSAAVLPPLPPPPVANSSTPLGGFGGIGAAQSVAPLPVPDQELGDILMVSSSAADKPTTLTEVKEGKKKGLTTVYLPPSFMEATLLSGLDAPTAGAAKGNPVPVLIRVKTPAVLPNEVKAQLTGCFCIADGRGNLSTERAELTLVSISCLDRRGGALIDQKIKGFVVDADGKIGLQGRVVAKFGAVVARSMLSGLLVGAGDAFKAQATTSSISPLGTTQSLNSKDLGMAALGNSLSEGFKEIQKFYMELARESMPIIEVGATKRITLVVSEGLNLEIKKLKGSGARQ